MFRSIKRIMEMNDKSRLVLSEDKFDGSGKLIIDLTVRDDSNFLSPFSYDASPTLSSEVGDFLDNSLRPAHYKKDLHIIFHSNEIDESEKPVYSAAIKNYYMKKYIAEKQKLKREIFIASIMLIAGIVMLGLMILFDNLGFSSIALEIVDIFAWVFLWEAADIYFLQSYVSRFQKHKFTGFSNATISFQPLTDK